MLFKTTNFQRPSSLVNRIPVGTCQFRVHKYNTSNIRDIIIIDPSRSWIPNSDEFDPTKSISLSLVIFMIIIIMKVLIYFAHFYFVCCFNPKISSSYKKEQLEIIHYANMKLNYSSSIFIIKQNTHQFYTYEDYLQSATPSVCID